MDAHNPEYLAAAAAMVETYGDRYAVGDHLAFRLDGWGENTFDDGKVIAHHNGLLLVETVSDIHEVDPRPWPLGHVLPF
jgi:hypothetical protein